MDDKFKLTGKVERRKRRSIELYHPEYNFGPKVVPEKKQYSRKRKHKNKPEED